MWRGIGVFWDFQKFLTTDFGRTSGELDYNFAHYICIYGF